MQKVKELEEYHTNFPTEEEPMSNKTENYLKDLFKPPYQRPKFSGEEDGGRFIDLHQNYSEFLNIKNIREDDKYNIGDYLWYLQNFDQFHQIPQKLKFKEYKKYKRYINNLAEYLKDFFSRINPLQNYKLLEKDIFEDFNYR